MHAAYVPRQITLTRESSFAVVALEWLLPSSVRAIMLPQIPSTFEGFPTDGTKAAHQVSPGHPMLFNQVYEHVVPVHTGIAEVTLVAPWSLRR